MQKTESADHTEMLSIVKRAIVDRSCAALSIDVFDTILWRRLPRPTDAFFVLGTKLHEQGICPPWIPSTLVRDLRIQAEQAARSNPLSPGVEVSLLDIWRMMPPAILGGRSVEELVEAEVSLERSITVTDLRIASVIELAEKYDVPVVLVSDTYFLDHHIRSLLDRPELAPLRNARLFRSVEYGVGKGSGLWEIVLKELQLRPEQLLHIGDHPLSDHAVPRRLGVRTALYSRLDDSLAGVFRRENEAVQPRGPLSSMVDPHHGDHGITSLRAKAVLSEIPRSTSGVAEAWRYGAGVLGPVLTGFAEWVAYKAHIEGTPVLWCPMREGEMLSTLINKAAKARGWNAVAKPIWLSRQVTAVASLDASSPGDVLNLVRRPYRPTVRQILGLFHLRPSDVPSLRSRMDKVIDSDSFSEEVADALVETTHLRNRIAISVKRARDRLLTSMQQCGALDHEDLVLVDLGWGGTTQMLLGRVLQQAQLDIRLSGLYLATNHRALRLVRNGLRVESYLAQGGHPVEEARTITRSPEVLEQIVSSLCGSLIDFTRDGRPVLGPYSDGPIQQAERTAARDGIHRFQDMWNDYVELAAEDWPTLVDCARPRLTNILVSALRLPTAGEASVFGTWSHDDNAGSQVITPLLDDDLLAAIPHMSPNDLAEFKMRDSFWPALAAASDPQLSAAGQALHAGVLNPDIFEPAGAPAHTQLRYRTADGTWHKGPRRIVRTNHNGLSYGRMRIEANGLAEIALALPGRRAIVRIDWIEIKAIAGGGKSPKTLRWETGKELANLRHPGCRWLGGTLFEFNGPAAELHLPLSTWNRPASVVQLTVGFGTLPCPESAVRIKSDEDATPYASRQAKPKPERSSLARRAKSARRIYRKRGLPGLTTATSQFIKRRTSDK